MSLVCLYLHFSMNYHESPEPSLRVKVQIFSIFGRPQRLYDGLRQQFSTPKVADFCGLSSDIFGFTLTAFPISPLYDLLSEPLTRSARDEILRLVYFFY